MYGPIILSTDMQNWHDCIAFQLPNSTAQCELIDISRFFLLCGFGGVQGYLVSVCAEVSTGSMEDKTIQTRV
jgi:hypothetical protein